jgi:hypothetical protein
MLGFIWGIFFEWALAGFITLLATGRAPALADIFPFGEKRITLVGPCCKQGDESSQSPLKKIPQIKPDMENLNPDGPSQRFDALVAS